MPDSLLGGGNIRGTRQDAASTGAPMPDSSLGGGTDRVATGVRTLLISEIFPPQKGGSGRWFWEIYRRLPRADYVIAAGEHAGQERFDAGHDLHVVRLPLRMSEWGLRSRAGLAGYWRNFRRLGSLVRREQIGRIHCGRCLPEGVLAWCLRWRYGVPYGCFVHGEDVGTAVHSREHTFLVRRVLGGAERVFANSHNTAGLLRRQWGVGDDRLRVLHPGVDASRFLPAAPDAGLRRRLGWDARPVILTVGRLQRRKGQDQLIRALPRIRQAFPDVLYAVIGEGEQRAALGELVCELGLEQHVQFFGEASDEELIPCYQQCDVFVLPNREIAGDMEGFGMVLLEAQACGRAVVAGASGGTGETMRSPESGRLVPCEEPEPLAEALLELLGDAALRRRMGEAGRAWVETHFSWEALVRQAAALFQESGEFSDKIR